MTHEQLVKWRDALAARVAAKGHAMFLGKPDMWYNQPRWFCCRGHVSRTYLKSEAYGGEVCLHNNCREFVVMGPPDVEPYIFARMVDMFDVIAPDESKVAKGVTALVGEFARYRGGRISADEVCMKLNSCLKGRYPIT